MKALNIIYWTSTILFALFMGMTGVQNLMMTQGSIDLISTDLGFPQYIIPFLGLAKVMGSLGLLIPIPPRLREWCYAGLFFDFIGALYAMVVDNGFDPMMLTLLVPFALMGLSYGSYHRRLELK
ncbi:MAG: DoxX family protein [Cyclobacteriaceae bacterium]|nr:DoxX family protein [Cyclobacteriaceae bacterium]